MTPASTPDPAVFAAWRDLVNLPTADLKAFLDYYGTEAGLSRAEAHAAGIKSGRESARWILKMRQALGGSKAYVVAETLWTPAMWQWARRQVNFNRRMRGARGKLYRQLASGDEVPTRKLLSLLVWGHDPERYETGRRGRLMKAILKAAKRRSGGAPAGRRL